MNLTTVVERVEVKAREVHVVRLVLTVLAVLPFAIGFVAFFAVRLLRLVVTWVWGAAVVGWEMANERRNQAST